MATLIPFLQQLTGINAIMFYAPVLLKSIGFGGNASLYSAVIIGAVNVVATLVSIFTVDKWGRRVLFLEAGVQIFLSQVVIGNTVSANMLFRFVIAQSFLAMPLPVWYLPILRRMGFRHELVCVLLSHRRQTNVPIEEMINVWRQHWFWKQIIPAVDTYAAEQRSSVMVQSQ
ncbi:hypothetical protein O6H91_17G005500 [Diphasiastrum complanatum]|uniref:Uncharacterized protein n=1 Tax=Diphasiastrum complanatum TaxID=34168 RepID=A0ACC2B3U8_DIPCM|nr:hypothetical protein O6H91_17G005500 [Diphasiastrum complanatum]